MIGALVSQLRAQVPGRTIIGADADRAVTIARSKYFDAMVQIPQASKLGYWEAALNAFSKFAPAVLVLGSDEEVEAIAPHSRRFLDAGLFVNVSSAESIAIMRDKLRTTQAAEAVGCRVAQTIVCSSFEDIRNAGEKLNYPARDFVIKPVNGRGRRRTYFISERSCPPKPDVPSSISLGLIETNLGAWSVPMLACEMIVGAAITIDLLCEHGSLRAGVVRRWKGPARFPFPGQEIIDRPKALSSLEKLVKLLGIHGMVDADLIEQENGDSYLLEINPRPSGSIAVTVAAGLPIFDALSDVLIGRTVRSLPQPSLRQIGPEVLVRNLP
jgi:ATP-grasp in the biosynthetic pathway with Ter operon